MNPDAIKTAAQAWERGRTLLKSGRFREAEPHFRDAIKAMPGSAALLSDYGTLAEKLEDWNAAAKIWQRVVELDPSRGAEDRAGLALLHLGQYGDAARFLERAVERTPAAGDAPLNLAVAWTQLGRDDDAIAMLRRALAMNPGYEPAWESLVTVLINNTRAAEAGETIAAARTRFPDNPELRFLDMEHRLKNRDYGAGFDLFDARWSTRFHAGAPIVMDKRRWDGEPFYGRLLVRAEQGIGDELLYSSLFSTLARAHFDNVIECDPRLLPLFTRSFPHLSFISRYLPEGDPGKPSFDRYIMAGDLCRLFRRRDADFPAAAGWLKADEAMTASLRDRVPAAPLRVGISWRSSHPSNGPAKSVSLERWIPLLSCQGVTFVNLQYGDASAELAALQEKTGLQIFDSGIDPLQDLDAQAALIASLDLVITTSNSTAHLAGALGVPTWVLLHRDVGLPWYWAYSGETVPWYPQTRLLRCPRRGAWDEVIATAAAQLAALRGPAH